MKTIIGFNLNECNPFAEAITKDTPENREYDYAASEVLKNAKTWFSKGTICRYKITHWNNIETTDCDSLKEVINKQYSKNIAEKIYVLLEGFSMYFALNEIKNLTQFKEEWKYYFRSTVAA